MARPRNTNVKRLSCYGINVLAPAGAVQWLGTRWAQWASEGALPGALTVRNLFRLLYGHTYPGWRLRWGCSWIRSCRWRGLNKCFSPNPIFFHVLCPCRLMVKHCLAMKPMRLQWWLDQRSAVKTHELKWSWYVHGPNQCLDSGWFVGAQCEDQWGPCVSRFAVAKKHTPKNIKYTGPGSSGLCGDMPGETSGHWVMFQKLFV